MSTDDVAGPSAGEQVTTEMAAPPRTRRATSPAAAALLNLTGLALGYAYLRRWWRTVLHLAGSVLLVAIAFQTDAAELPWLWRGLAVAWLVWMAVDGWLIARRGPRLRGVRGQWVPVGVAVVVVAAVVAGYLAYVGAANRTFAEGVSAQGRADCAAATASFALVSGIYELTLGSEIRDAEERSRQCADFVAARDRRAAGEHADAVRRFREFRVAYPGTALVPFVGNELRTTFSEWARQHRQAGDHTAAIEIYRDALTEPDADPGFRSELAATYLERAAAARSDASQLDRVKAAMADLLLIQSEFGTTPAAGQVPQAVADTFAAANMPFAQRRFCDAVPVLDYFVTVPDVGGVVGTAHANRAVSLLECGLERFRSGSFDGAIGSLDTFLRDYPNDPGAAQARSAIIAATVAKAKDGPPPPLPAPFGAGPPGGIPVQVFNDNPHEVRVLITGTTAHEIVVPGCPTCPETYLDPAAGCPTLRGRPSITVRLPPGTYDIYSSRPADPTVRPFVATRTYEPRFTYTECFWVSPTL